MKKKFSVLVMLLLALLLTGCKKSASDYNKEGMAFYESGDYNQAQEYLAKAVSMEKDNTKYLLNHAMTLIQTGDPDKAIEQFEKTITDKKSNKAQKNNKLAYRGLGMAYMEKLDYAKAVECFDTALECGSKEDWDTDIRYYLANATYLNGNLDGALALYSDIIAVDPDNGLAYNGRATIYRERGEYDKAINDYNNAILHSKGGFEIYIGMASYYFDIGQKEKAEEALFLASLLDVKTDRDKYYLGVIHYYEGHYESARAEMEYALANGIKDANFYLAEICVAEGKYSEALDYFNTYQAKTVVGSATLCNDLAVCYINTGDYDLADEWIEKGLSYNSVNVQRELRRNQVACAEARDDLDKAYNLLCQYLRDYKGDESAFTELKWLVERMDYVIPFELASEYFGTGDIVDAPISK